MEMEMGMERGGRWAPADSYTAADLLDLHVVRELSAGNRSHHINEAAKGQ
jgi:hypothetical protein